MRVFGLVLLLVFAVEGAIMLGLPRLSDAWQGRFANALLDAMLLTLVLAPAIWLLSIKPLQQLFAARGRLLRRLFESQENERSRVARDLHDGIGQHLTALLVGLRTVEQAPDITTAHGRAHELRELALRAHDEVRSLARGLGPVALQELGLAAALEQLCQDFERTHHVDVSLACDTTRAAEDVETALYRIAQEALTNVARHAQAARVEVRLARDAASIRLSIRDDGNGLPSGMRASGSGPRGFGLRSIRERAELLGGDLFVTSEPGQGTALEVRLPVARSA